jgi:cysteine synthase A
VRQYVPEILLGNTPLVRINSLSDALGVEILGKAEVRLTLKREILLVISYSQFLNPGGSVKDRVALRSKICGFILAIG